MHPDSPLDGDEARRLLERAVTADVGHLAADADIRAFLHGAPADDTPCVIVSRVQVTCEQVVWQRSHLRGKPELISLQLRGIDPSVDLTVVGLLDAHGAAVLDEPFLVENGDELLHMWSGGHTFDDDGRHTFTLLSPEPGT